jgi:hypothetical protein
MPRQPEPLTREVLVTLDEVRERVLRRLKGLTDGEYLWEPVPGCMTVRPSADGVFRADPRPRQEPQRPPFTTIAWRMWHMGSDCLRAYGRFFDDHPLGDRQAWPAKAEAAVELLDADWDAFRSRVASLGDARLQQPMGERAGQYAHETFLQLALHALDETAHHGGEIGALRDLYAHGLGN